MRWFICAAVLACFASDTMAVGPITLGNSGAVPSSVTNATMDSDVSTITPTLTLNSVSLQWNGIVTWTGTRGTSTQKMERDQYVEFNVNFPTLISSLSINGNYKWVNAGGAISDPTSKSFANAEIYQYIDTNNNGHYDPGIDTLYFVPTTANTTIMTGIGNGYWIKNGTYSDSTNYVLGPGTSYILLAEIIDTTTFASPNVSDPDNVYTAEFPSPDFGGIGVSFNYVTVPEPTGVLIVTAMGLLVRRRRGIRSAAGTRYSGV